MSGNSDNNHDIGYLKAKADSTDAAVNELFAQCKDQGDCLIRIEASLKAKEQSIDSRLQTVEESQRDVKKIVLGIAATASAGLTGFLNFIGGFFDK